MVINHLTTRLDPLHLWMVDGIATSHLDMPICRRSRGLKQAQCNVGVDRFYGFDAPQKNIALIIELYEPGKSL